jgi:nitrogen fixation protein NifU and related proteins
MRLTVSTTHPLTRMVQIAIGTMPYSEIFKDHLANPRNAGELPDANSVAEETNPVCGDRLRLSLRICDGRIEAARFLAYGCPPTLVCGSVLAEMIECMTTDEAMNLTRDQIVDSLEGLAPQKRHAAALAIETLRAALKTTGRQTEIRRT